MLIDLTGKTVLVTGASRGIGHAIARSIGEAGARVAVHYNRNPEPAKALVEGIGNGAFAIKADLADPDACEGLFEHTVAQMGRLDVLVNNAAVSLKMPLEASTSSWLSDWNLTMAINLRSVELLSRLAVLHYREHDGGRIINVASRAAFRGDTAEYMAYAASKAGVVALTKSIARAFGKDNVTTFALAPGFTRTDMAQDFIDTYGEAYTVDDLALNRMTEPEDIAPLVTLLASGLADHATGTSIDINAGSYVH